MATIGTDIDQAARILRNGDLVGIPTETVYGLAGNALNSDAILKIFEVKKRPSFDPLIVHIDSVESLHEYVLDIPVKADKLAKVFWPGPLTLIFPKNAVIPDVVTSGLSTVAIRIPSHPLTLLLLKSLDFPLAAPSANPFGYVSPTTASHVDDQLGYKLSYILDGGICDIGIESTIIGFEQETPVIQRLGGKTVEEIEDIVGRVHVERYSTSQPIAPGMLQSHYAPGKKKVFLGQWSDYQTMLEKEKTALIRFQHPDTNFPSNRQAILSEQGDLKEAAKNLFTTLRKFDTSEIDYIVAELVPETGFGRAINDRLRRAAAIG